MNLESITKLFNQFKVKLSKTADRLSLLNLLTILGVLSALTTAVWFLGLKPKAIKAGWWNDNWMYRKSIQVTNNTSEETDVYISITIDTSNTDKFQGDCGDLRFTKQNGQQLDYYISSGCGTVSTVIHVNFDTFPAGSQAIYYYYGNSTAENGFSASGFGTEASNYTIGSIGSEEQSPGPIAYWKFDEGYGNTAHDSTQNANDMSLGTGSSAPSWQSEDMCLSGKCLKFDGTDDYTQYPEIDLDLAGATITWWMKRHETREETIFGDKIGCCSSFIEVDKGGTEGRFFSEPYANNEFHLYPQAGTINDNKWHHFAVKYTQSGNDNNMKVYVDGIFRGEDTSTDGSFDELLKLQYIGMPTYGSHFKGFIDEVKIYPYARTAEEIKADYTAGLAGMGSVKGASAAFGSSSNKWLSEGLVGYWKMDEASWDGTAEEVIDSSGNENHGQGIGATSPPTTGAGKFGNAGIFDGSEDQVKVIGCNYLKSGENQFTLSAWIYPEGYGNDFGPIIGTEYGNNLASGLTIASTDQLYFKDYPGSNSTQIGTLSLNEWQHVTLTYNNGTVTGYINGVKEKTFSFTKEDVDAATVIGRATNPWNTYRAFDGKIDEARVYNRALSPAEVRDLYNWAPRPIGYWKLDEGSGTDAYDSSGNDRTGTLSNGAWASGKFGKGLYFDGSGDYLEINDF